MLLQSIACGKAARQEREEPEHNARSMGVMQINSLWLEPLSKYGAEKKHLAMPAQHQHRRLILRKQINEVGHNPAVAHYHCARPIAARTARARSPGSVRPEAPAGRAAEAALAQTARR
jgi:hypothetical protein